MQRYVNMKTHKTNAEIDRTLNRTKTALQTATNKMLPKLAQAIPAQLLLYKLIIWSILIFCDDYAQ